MYSYPTFTLDNTKYNQHYFDKAVQVIDKALQAHPRTIAIRFDLRTPELPISCCSMEADSPFMFADIRPDVISRFFASLKSKLSYDLKKREAQGKRVYKNELRYIWVREFTQDNKPHYHVLISLNKDCYYNLGDYNRAEGSLASIISDAWASAMRIDSEYASKLIHFPQNPIYYLNRNDPPMKLNDDISPLFNRVLYFTKYETKITGTGNKNIGYSLN